MELNDKWFYDQYVKDIKDGIPRGHCVAIPCTSQCQICTRPLFGAAHEEWHTAHHAAKLGLTYE